MGTTVTRSVDMLLFCGTRASSAPPAYTRPTSGDGVVNDFYRGTFMHLTSPHLTSLPPQTKGRVTYTTAEKYTSKCNWFSSTRRVHYHVHCRRHHHHHHHHHHRRRIVFRQVDVMLPRTAPGQNGQTCHCLSMGTHPLLHGIANGPFLTRAQTSEPSRL